MKRYNSPMPMMLSKTYDAFKEAGVPDRKAREAAEEIAGFWRRRICLEAMLLLIVFGVLGMVVASFLG